MDGARKNLVLEEDMDKSESAHYWSVWFTMIVRLCACGAKAPIKGRSGRHLIHSGGRQDGLVCLAEEESGEY